MLLDFQKLGGFRWLLIAVAGFAALFILMPIVFIVALSFGSSRWLAFPPPSWTLKWYHELAADPRWLEAAFTSAKIFSFLVSWDEVVVAIFMASPTLQTLPVRIWAVLRQDLTPVIAAASTLLLALTLSLMALAAYLRKDTDE